MRLTFIPQPATLTSIVQSFWRTISILLLAIAGIASIGMTCFGIVSALWGGIWSGSNPGASVLNLALWLLPMLSIVAFLLYFWSRFVGLSFSWVIAIGSIITLFLLNLGEFAGGESSATNLFQVFLGALMPNFTWALVGISLALSLTSIAEDRALR